jgi:hypothetical protein
MAVRDSSDYAVRYAVDYPEDGLDRLTTAFRLIWILPIAVVAGLLGGSGGGLGGPSAFAVAGVAGSVLFLPPLLMILFREKYPRWWFDWNVELVRFSARVGAYGALLTDRYPATDDEQAIHVEIDYPDVERDLTRWLPLVKWLLVIPHVIVLFVLGIIAFFAVIAAWFAILFTGRYPRGLFDFVVGVTRWGLRVEGYALLLVTDRYPPFSMD